MDPAQLHFAYNNDNQCSEYYQEFVPDAYVQYSETYSYVQVSLAESTRLYIVQ